MKKVLASLTLTALLLVPAMASAWCIFGVGTTCGQSSVQPGEAPQADVMEILDSLTNWLFAILLIVAAIFIIVAAFNFVTAAGDPDKTKTARNFVLYALIGVLVGFAAKGLVMLVSNIVQPAM